MSINREWHAAHKMPKNPTDTERLKWHLDHAKHCDCRPAPDWMKSAMTKHKRTRKDVAQ